MTGDQVTPLQVLLLLTGACVLTHVQLSATPWTVAHQAALSMEFSRQEHWSGLPFPPPGDLPDPGIEPVFPVSPAVTGGFFTTEPSGKPSEMVLISKKIHFPLFGKILSLHPIDNTP